MEGGKRRERRRDWVDQPLAPASRYLNEHDGDIGLLVNYYVIKVVELQVRAKGPSSSGDVYGLTRSTGLPTDRRYHQCVNYEIAENRIDVMR